MKLIHRYTGYIIFFELDKKLFLLDFFKIRDHFPFLNHDFMKPLSTTGIVTLSNLIKVLEIIPNIHHDYQSEYYCFEINNKNIKGYIENYNNSQKLLDVIKKIYRIHKIDNIIYNE